MLVCNKKSFSQRKEDPSSVRAKRKEMWLIESRSKF